MVGGRAGRPLGRRRDGARAPTSRSSPRSTEPVGPPAAPSRARYALADDLVDPGQKSLVDTLGSQLLTQQGDGESPPTRRRTTGSASCRPRDRDQGGRGPGRRRQGPRHRRRRHRRRPDGRSRARSTRRAPLVLLVLGTRRRPTRAPTRSCRPRRGAGAPRRPAWWWPGHRPDGGRAASSAGSAPTRPRPRSPTRRRHRHARRPGRHGPRPPALADARRAAPFGASGARRTASPSGRTRSP